MNIIMKWWIGSILLLLLSNAVTAQIELELVIADKDTTFIQDQISVATSYNSLDEIGRVLKDAVTDLQTQGYWLASVDSLVYEEADNLARAFLFVGAPIEFGMITNGNIDPKALSAIGYRTSTLDNKPLDHQRIRDIQDRLLVYAENNGFPFARVWLDSIQIIENHKKKTLELYAQLFWHLSSPVTFSKLQVEGKANISTHFLERYLDIRAGDLYNEQRLRDVNRRVQSLPFLKLRQTPAVIFTGNEAEVTVFLDKQNASRFDLVVGFLPQNDLTGRALITGSFQGVLQNPFGTGKVVAIDWQRLKAETSRLQIDFSYPYVLKSPLGLEGALDIYRRDSTLQDTEFDVGVQYLFRGNNYVKIFWRSLSSNVLTINENQIINTRSLPAILDWNNTTLGLEYRLQQLNNQINPSEGFAVQAQTGIGIKTIRKNASILGLSDPNDADFDFGTLYDSLNETSLQFNSRLSWSYFVPFGKRATIKLGFEGGWRFSLDSLYQNEVFRIGGNRLLRGFDEESIPTSLYSILTLEPRFLLNSNSYLFAFFDYAYLQNYTIGNQIEDFPFGFGLGLSLGTPAGVVKVSYAIGRQLDNPIDFRAAKIHFGYVNYF